MNLLKALFLTLLLVAYLPPGCYGQSSDSDPKKTTIHILTDKIVDIELDLLELNTIFRIATDYQSKSRTVRQFLYNLTASGVSLGGTTTIVSHRYSGFPPDSGVTGTGALCLVIGQSIVEGGVVIEYLLDKLKDRKVKKLRCDPDSMKARVEKLKIELDDLIVLREKEIDRDKSLSAHQLKIMRAEGLVLKDVRDLGLVEFARFFADEAGTNSSRNLSYLNGLLATAAGGHGGSLIGLISAATGDKRLAIPAGIGFIVSSTIVMLSPLTNKYFSKRAKRKASKDIRLALGKLTTDSVATMDGDLNRLSVAVNSATAPDKIQHVADRLAVYAAEYDMLIHQINREVNEVEKSRKQFKSRMLANYFISAPKMAWGTMLVYAGSNEASSPRAFNSTVAQAATVYTVGQSFWLGDTLLSSKKPKALKFTVGGEIRLPVEKLEKRIARIKEIEKLVVDTKN